MNKLSHTFALLTLSGGRIVEIEGFNNPHIPVGEENEWCKK